MSSEFDRHAENYERDLEAALSISGENKDYFAEGRMRFLKGLLDKAQIKAATVLDFGCGTGNGIPHAAHWLEPQSLIGSDISIESIRIAKTRQPSFLFLSNHELPKESIDLVYCNGVVHHVHPEKRLQMFQDVHRCLKPGGCFAMFENHRWHPATRWVMRSCAFDRDAVPLSASEGRKWMNQAGFEVLGTHYLFFFPRLLRKLRFLEPRISLLPLGTQYLVWAKKSLR